MDKNKLLAESFERGFIEKCAEAGVDGEELLKQAGLLGSLGRGVRKFTGEGVERLGKRFARHGDDTIRGIAGRRMAGWGADVASAARRRGLQAGGIGQGYKGTTTLAQKAGPARGKLPGRAANTEFTEQVARTAAPMVSDTALGAGATAAAGLGGLGAYNVMKGSPDNREGTVPPEVLAMMLAQQGQQPAYTNPYTASAYGAMGPSRYDPYNWAM